MNQKKKTLWQRLGPGFITGAADDDPSGIATYSQTGALFGYTHLWVALFTFPLMLVVQEMCGRIGTVTGDGLSGVIRKFYSKKVLAIALVLLLGANIINIGADLGAMASAMNMVFGLPFVVWLMLVTVGSLLLQILVPYPTYAKFLKYLTLSLLAYVLAAFVIKQDWSVILYTTFTPTFAFNKASLLNIVAILGTTISPYLFFWQADEEVEEQIAHNKILGFGIGKPKLSKQDFKDLWIDTGIGMLFSNLVMFFIMVTVASTIGANGPVTIETATQAAQALRPLVGDFAYLLFAIGIVGTGLLAVPVLAGSASFAVAEAFGWSGGLEKKFKDAHGFYGVMIVAMAIGFLVNFLGIPPFQMLYYTAVLNGLAAPILLMMILTISNNKKIMGAHTNGILSNVLGVAITALMTAAGIALFLF
ncbi:iron transporter [Candidatus Uhrbacteria bacterium RIFOXYB2_FULL_45_11]|uniref:Iron transporter n=1 Tax=Candidatus Uhrbacteria bacterium RIFOXYB2_FULL_45_11 TaxID=1802421 RepID=A0A1F7WAL7_9BACT|nr:MAG: iron transporter [Candidatus Uhrbacteria bacterium RIFOXYB2_FULL_45_11]